MASEQKPEDKWRCTLFSINVMWFSNLQITLAMGMVPEYDIGWYQNPFLVPVPSVPGSFGTDTDIRYLCQAWSSYKGVVIKH